MPELIYIYIIIAQNLLCNINRQQMSPRTRTLHKMQCSSQIDFFLINELGQRQHYRLTTDYIDLLIIIYTIYQFS